MDLLPAVSALCRCWSTAPPASVAVMGASGFSGAGRFVVEWPDSPGRFVLKSFHAAASFEHAKFVHHLARHLRAEGVLQVPEVIPALDGDTIVRDAEDRLWELARFMPGVAVPRPASSQAAAATETLARLHLAAAGLPGYPPRSHASPGHERRIEQARLLLASPWQARHAAWSRAARDRLSAEAFAALGARAAAAIEVFSAAGADSFIARVASMRAETCVLQPVLRDVWCDHVLFADERSDAVTAIIDLHAAGIDTPATDLARLMGSWTAAAGSEQLSLRERWPEAVAAYNRVRRLSREEAGLIPFLHATGIVLGLDNWFRWTFEEHREFSDMRSMLDRIDSLLKELPAAIATAWSAAGNID